jgi:hypothetical protein
VGLTAVSDGTNRGGTTMKTAEQNADDHFGVCPHCGKNDGYLNVGRSHWFYCKEHRVKWCSGANLFSWWRHQTEEEQRRLYDEVGLGEFKDLYARHLLDEFLERLKTHNKV